MRKLKPIIARTPEELAGALGLSGVAAKEMAGSAHVAQETEGDLTHPQDHARRDREARRHFAKQNHSDP